MSMGFDMLAGLQLCMVIFLFVFALRHHAHSQGKMHHFLISPCLYVLWNGVTIYYFADFFYLAVLWFMMGALLSVGCVILMRHHVLHVCYYQTDGMFYYPCTLCMLIFLVVEILVLTGVQEAVYYMPLLVHSWLFNELLGFIPGFVMGLLWGILFVAFFLFHPHNQTEHTVMD